MDPTSPHFRKGRSGASRVLICRLLALALVATLAACGGGGGDSTSSSGGLSSRSAAAGSGAQDGADGESSSLWSGLVGAIDGALNKIGIDIGAEPKAGTTQLDAVRLANQATFGPNEALIAQIRQQGPALWIAEQMNLQRQAVKRVPGAADVVTTVALPKSRYTSGGTNAVHKDTTGDFCADKGSNCWRDWSSSTPLVWDFYRNAVHSPDQLRLRVGLALQQMLVISNYEVSGTYGLRNYNNMLLDNAFGNYRDVLENVILSPVMGDYLDHVNNDKNAPNENFARELLQLFSLGTCLLNTDGSLQGGTCTPTYDNERVREYAFALTGWTYPAGGATPWGCYPSGANCQFYDGNMVVKTASMHNTQPRTLLSGVTLGNGNTAPAALQAVLNSIMAHQNVAPFVSRHLIQQLVTSNPSPAYVQRVVTAFNTGRYGTFGGGKKGDLAATVAAVLLDTEARSTPTNTAGRLREPIQLFTAVLRALNGRTDGDALGWWWGEEMREHVFRPPSVFNFYPPDYPVAGTTPPLVGPAFGIHNANTALNRLNYINYLVFWDGSNPGSDVPNAVGTKVDLTAFTADATNAATLVDRLSLLALGEPLPTASRTAVINAVNAYSSSTASGRTNRVKQAAFLVFASPQFQMTR
ncbi:DUF1800 domain-containing protein [Hydrogenophaga sp. MI9]|uniref:DUF1800 domain-containing protein n=1 Tax=Hydrogenophaga sp. MI9 TaxID=3453719 RepID=UPI003EEC6E0B